MVCWFVFRNEANKKGDIPNHRLIEVLPRTRKADNWNAPDIRAQTFWFCFPY
jgi:hypothetical protein